jgi:hypothetical protein
VKKKIDKQGAVAMEYLIVSVLTITLAIMLMMQLWSIATRRATQDTAQSAEATQTAIDKSQFSLKSQQVLDTDKAFNEGSITN